MSMFVRRGWRAVIAFFATLAMLFTATAHATPTAPLTAKNWGDEFGTKVSAKRIVTRPELDNTELYALQELQLRFEWEVPTGTEVKPGETITIELPEWMDTSQPLRDYKGTSGEENITCNAEQFSRTITCTFTDVVEEPRIDVSGAVEFPVTLRAHTGAPAITWGGKEFNIYQDLTGKADGDIKVLSIQHAQIFDHMLARYGKEFEYPQGSGKRYVQVLWDVIASAKQSDTGKIVFESTFDEVTYTDRNGVEKKVGQILAPADEGFIDIRRRDAGEEYDNGSWEEKEADRCKEGGDVHANGLVCSDLVFLSNAEGQKNWPGEAGETITTSAHPQGEQWVATQSELNKLSVTIDNPVAGAGYRLQFYTLLPLEAAGDDIMSSKTVVSNTVSINGTPVSQKTPLFSKKDGTSASEADTGSIVLDKKVIGDGPAEMFDFEASWAQGGESKIKAFQLGGGEQITLADIPVGTQVTITEKLANDSWTPDWSAEESGHIVSVDKATAVIAVPRGVAQVVLTNRFNPPAPSTTPTPPATSTTTPTSTPTSAPPATTTSTTPSTPAVTPTTEPSTTTSTTPVVPVGSSEPKVPWYWILIPLVPLVPFVFKALVPGSSSQGSSNGSSGPKSTTAPGAAPSQAPVKGIPAHRGAAAGAVTSTTAKQPQIIQVSTPERANKASLANTGASVIGLVLVSLLVIIGGLVLVARSRARRD